MTTFGITRRYGISGFFLGWRTGLAVALLPIHLLLLGVGETCIFRRMAGRNQESASIVAALLREPGGYVNLLKYAAMTAVQALPGFVLFSATRLTLQGIFGETASRHRARKARERKLKDIWDGEARKGF